MTVSTAHIQRGLNAGNGQQARIEAERKAEAEAEEKARAKAEAERKRKEFAERLYRDVCERFGITGEKGKERLISSTP
jgi:membrane protein involved in colicin uptake